MDIKTNSISSLPTSAMMALIATCLLFISIPLLTKISTVTGEKEEKPGIWINQWKPLPPPEPEQEERLEEIKKQEIIKKDEPRHTMPQPRLNVATNLTPDTFGTIQVNNILNRDIKVTESIYASAYKPNEVDQQPSPLRTFQPKYPFEAQQKGIEGKILVRFVVDSAGIPQEPEIYSVEPKEVEGVFEEAALACVMKYKFKPARKGGKAVDCIARIPFTFSVSE